MRVIGDIARLGAKRYPDKKAIIMNDDYLTFKQLNQLSNQLAYGLLSLGVKKDDKVALLAYNCLEFVIVNYAVAKCGAVLVPINFRFKAEELIHIIQNCEPKILFFGAEFAPLIEECKKEYDSSMKLASLNDAPSGEYSLRKLVDGRSTSNPPIEVDPNAPAAIMYTSGTTGFPKGVLSSHSALLNVNIGIIYGGDLRYNDIALVPVPLFHNGGLNVLLQPTLEVGGTAVIMEKGFDPEKFLSFISRHNVTLTMCVPTQLAMIINNENPAKHKIPTLQKMYYGSSAISPEVLKSSMEFFNTGFYQWYGQSEAGIVSVLRPEDHIEHSQCTGREMFHADIRIVDLDGNDTPVGEIGEIISAQQYLGMIGYHKMEEATNRAIQDGWIHTEDLARVEGEGFFTVVDRQRDMIISGGENIYSKEIEDVIIRHPLVKEVAVFGVPDDLWGEAVCAAVVKQEKADLTEEDIIQFCASHLSSYKKPKKVDFLDDLPKNASGKVKKGSLREVYWKERKRRI